MLLIFPPVAKSCEPPAGIAKLAGALEAHGIPVTLWDANLEGLLHLAGRPISASDTWTRRAIRNLPKNLAALRDLRTYRSRDRYNRAVYDVSRVLEVAGREYSAVIGLADYHHHRLSPVRSVDLLFAAEHPEENPFYGYFKKRLPKMLEESFLAQRRRDEREDETGTGKIIVIPAKAGVQGFRKKVSGFRIKPGMTAVDITEQGNIIGFSLNFLSQALTTFAMIGYIRKEFPGLRIALGGGLVTSWMKRPGWKNPFGGLIDEMIAGPGEGPLLGLFGIHDNGQDHGPPDYSSFPLENYLSPGFILPYSASSGCFWNKCSFCPETAEGSPYIPVPASRAMRELGGLIKKKKPVLVHLLDNAVSPALMGAIADDPPGAPWYGFARIGKELADPEFCTALKRAGCAMLKLGLESGDQGVLDRMQKGIDLETASRVLKNLRAVGIATYVYLLFGTPAETAMEARRTLDFTVRHGDAITFLNLAIFNMPACSAEAGAYETEQFYEGDLSLYTGFRHPRGWDRKQVRLFLDNEFKRHPAVAAIIKKDPPVFTSNHAAFFCQTSAG
jgi:hypothetical protein